MIALARFSLHQYCIVIGRELQSKYILEKVMIKVVIKMKSNFFIMVLTIANPHHDQPGSLLIPLNSPPGTSQHCSQGRLGSGIPHNSKSIVTDWVQTYLKEA